ncbi:putative 14-3-3 protein [Helianthus annuus]|nr:putative 14-3-3 protein [Helianthus annuus]
MMVNARMLKIVSIRFQSKATEQKETIIGILQSSRLAMIRKRQLISPLKAYQLASTSADAELSSTHPNKLGFALNFSVFYFEIMNSPESLIP